MMVKFLSCYAMLLSLYVIDISCMYTPGYSHKCDARTIVTSFREASPGYIALLSSLLNELRSAPSVDGICTVDMRFIEAAIFKQAQLKLSTEHRQSVDRQDHSYDDYGAEHNY